MRLYAETPCEHGRSKPHRIDRDKTPGYGGDGNHCPGGSRWEIIMDYEAAKRAFEREFPCHCDPAFADRGRHSSECVFDESEAVTPIVNAAIGGGVDL